jgi:acetyltransferase
MSEAARAVAGMIKEFGKPIVVQCHYATFETDAIDILRAADVAVLRSIEISAGSLAAVQQYHEWSSRSADPAATAVEPSRAAREIVAGAAGRGSLLETEARALLAEHGVRMPPSALVRGPREVARLDPRLKTGPVALKIVSRDILHQVGCRRRRAQCVGRSGDRRGRLGSNRGGPPPAPGGNDRRRARRADGAARRGDHPGRDA